MSLHSLNYYYCVCIRYTSVSACRCVEVRGQLDGVSSLLEPSISPFFWETSSLCVTLAVLELVLWTNEAQAEEILLPLPPELRD